MIPEGPCMFKNVFPSMEKTEKKGLNRAKNLSTLHKGRRKIAKESEKVKEQCLPSM